MTFCTCCGVRLEGVNGSGHYRFYRSYSSDAEGDLCDTCYPAHREEQVDRTRSLISRIKSFSFTTKESYCPWGRGPGQLVVLFSVVLEDGTQVPLSPRLFDSLELAQEALAKGGVPDHLVRSLTSGRSGWILFAYPNPERIQGAGYTPADGAANSEWFRGAVKALSEAA